MTTAPLSPKAARTSAQILSRPPKLPLASEGQEGQGRGHRLARLPAHERVGPGPRPPHGAGEGLGAPWAGRCTPGPEGAAHPAPGAPRPRAPSSFMTARARRT